MAFDTQIQVFLDGALFTNIIHFSLEENIGKHTEFRISVRGQSLEDSLYGNSILENSRNYLGKKFTVAISGLKKNGYQNFEFTGTITQVRGKKGKKHGGLGDIIDIVGFSNSIFLDDGSHMNSFLEKNLSEVVAQIVSNYSNPAIKVKTVLENDATINYAVQNKQSAFAYLQYLAASNGEYLFYNTDTLYFGKPDLGEEIVLTYEYDLKDFYLGLETQSLNFNYFSNDYYSESSNQAFASQINSNANGYTAAVSSISKEVFPVMNQRLFSTFEDTNLQQRIDTAVTLQKKLAEQKQVTLFGESVNTGVSLGKIIKIKSTNGNFGSYRVTSVKHFYEINGKYKNEFTAIPLEIDIYPLTDISIVNKAQSQIAKVKDTADPEGMSRIKVQFPWQVPTNQTTPWIRVATPYAGGDRGFHVLPEVNDEVLIGFENGEVERPFMQSALYTGVNKHNAWQSDKNDFKGITTKGGHIIELNDTKGGEMITITDKNGNMLRFDTVSNNVTVTALENMTFNAKNMVFNVEENMDITVGENHTLNAKNSDEYIDENKIIDVTESFDQTSSEATIVASNGDMSIEGAGIATFQGGADVKISKG
ncbi:phage baseplate assembly protein V [Aquimarina algiphila]|uniref:phage baseplate assembly protein V n=1 Tax=Aquimarina algiphila TaxID=2047982 RepID=UPI0023311030|nr:phage baseplate assembly protein V [Aquimarina algiphila]